MYLTTINKSRILLYKTKYFIKESKMNEIDAQQELAFIRKVIADSRQASYEASVHFLLWGILVVITMAIDYLKSVITIPISSYVLWSFFFCTGWICSILIGIKQNRKARARTFGGKLMGAVWIACGVVGTAVMFILPNFHALQDWAIMPAIGLVLGIGHYLSGVIQKDRWLFIGGIGWWVGSIIMVIWPTMYNPIIFMAMIIFFQIIPGWRLYRQWKVEQGRAV
jgi:hypothetical protein